MKTVLLLFVAICASLNSLLGANSANAPLPAGAPKDPWSLDDAWNVRTETRTRWSLNGLWGVRPPLDGDRDGVVPSAQDNWGWCKIPSVWGHPVDYRCKGQEVVFAPGLKKRGIASVLKDRAWFRREFVMPADTDGKKVVLTFTMLQTHAVVYVDGRKAAEVSFPGGEADITDHVKPGHRQTIALYVTAYPMSSKTFAFNAPGRADQKKSEVKLKGITGDLYLDAYPVSAHISDSTVECDVAGGRMKFVSSIGGVDAGSQVRLVAKVFEAANMQLPVKVFNSGKVVTDAGGNVSFTAEWKDAKIWDVHTPHNRYVCRMELRDVSGRLIDAQLPFGFGFRDVRLNGRELFLNGKPLHLRALRNTTMNSPAGVACRTAAFEMVRRLKSLGFNAIINGNYDFSPGEVSYMDGLLEACDETGMLVSFSLPHVRDVDMKIEEPRNASRYRNLTKWVMSRARNHPSVILYAMNHNYAGYAGDMNPLRIDGRYDLVPEEGNKPLVSALDRRRRAHAAYQIAKSLDSTRPIYHHESGNLDEFHTSNIYLNWSPVQERSDWLEHWSVKGVKPLFFVEWGIPHLSSWSSYRGPLFIHTNPVFQSLLASEYAAQLYGDAAYEGDSKGNVEALKMEEGLWSKGEPFIWYKMHQLLKKHDRNYYGVMAKFISDNWKSHRAWGITAMLPWDQDRFHKGGGPHSRENPDRWKNLKCPGIVSDIVYDEGWATGTGDAVKYSLTAAGSAFLRWNMDDCAFIGGESPFTDKRHHYRPGEKVRKTLVVLNDRRVPQTVSWRCELRERSGKVKELREGTVDVPAGTRRDVPVVFSLPPENPDRFSLVASFAFAGGVVQHDTFSLETYAKEGTASVPDLLLYDPKGLTSAEFTRLGIRHRKIDVLPEVASHMKLVVGRNCLTRELLDRLLVPVAKAQGRVLVFEQDKDTLESVGFRAQTYGLRNAFPRYRDRHLGIVLDDDMLRDWNGESTLAPPYTEGLARNELAYPCDTWAGFSNSRVWRCGNRGNVSTAIPEKPSIGDWRAIVDGGFDLQYAPLLDWTIADGRITFCQLDVTARTVPDPVAENIVNRLVSRLGSDPKIWPKQPKTFGMIAWTKMRDIEVKTDQRPYNFENGLYRVYVVSSGAKCPKDFHKRVEEGAKVLCLGLSAGEVAEWSPVPLKMSPTNGCYASRIERIPSALNGLSNADWSWHGAMDFDAFTEPAEDGNAAIRVIRYGKGRMVFWQVPPWKIDDVSRPYLRSSKRRANAMLWRILGNMEFYSGATSIRYADVPVAEDDPYRYYRW